MRIAVLAFVLLPAAAFAGERDVPLPASHLALTAAPKAAKPAKAECQNPRMGYAIPTAGKPARVGTLAQEPLGNLYLGVQRLEDGCDLPVKIADAMGDKQR
jgi:hypothetical protein